MSAFDAQLTRLVDLGYPKLMGLGQAEFVSALRPLAESLPLARRDATALATDDDGDGSDGRVPFVVVIAAPRAQVESTLPLIERRSLQAIERLYPHTPASFSAIDSVALPDGDAYLLTDVDRGAETINVTPNDAYESIAARGRTPLTIAEGVALLTHFPEFLQPNNCFSMLASRAGDKRVPAFWLSEKRPKLGWCWAGNPHTWLGSASAGERIGDGVSFG